MAKDKSSAQLPFGSLEWAEAKLREDPNDLHALNIALKLGLKRNPAKCLDTGLTEKCRRSPQRIANCDLCGRPGTV